VWRRSTRGCVRAAGRLSAVGRAALALHARTRWARALATGHERPRLGWGRGSRRAGPRRWRARGGAAGRAGPRARVPTSGREASAVGRGGGEGGKGAAGPAEMGQGGDWATFPFPFSFSFLFISV
jgi:hypothetical protein